MSGELSLHATTPREPLARKVPTMSFQQGARIGGYRVVAPLGTGGMGRVFLADDEKLARKVALKILPPEDADDEGRARFLREAQALARVQHKNVVQVFASGVDEDVAWMALEYVEGDPLGALVDGAREGIDEETALSLCAQAARGLAAVHDVGVVHRDVKPDNLLIDDNACVRVLDFGVALFLEAHGVGGFVTQKGVAVGTPHFMAPEQARGGTIDARADAWGLGATLFTLLVGRPPFYTRDDEPDLDILARVLRERAPGVRDQRPEVSAATAAVVARMLEPAGDQRLADMREIAGALDDIADALASGATPAVTQAPPADVAGARSDAHGGAGEAPRASAAGEAPDGGATGKPRASSGRLLALAVSFAALGAVVAYQLVDALAPPPPAPVVVVQPPRPPPVEVTPPVVDEAPPEPPTPPTADALEQRVRDSAERNPAALDTLLGRDDVEAKAAVARLASTPGALGKEVIDAIADRRALVHMGALEQALMKGERARALHIVELLEGLKAFEALDVLDRASREHPDKAVRARALAARQSLFHVEGG